MKKTKKKQILPKHLKDSLDALERSFKKKDKDEHVAGGFVIKDELGDYTYKPLSTAKNGLKMIKLIKSGKIKLA